MKRFLFILILGHSTALFSQNELNEAAIFDNNHSSFLMDDVAYLPLYAKGSSTAVAVTNTYLRPDNTVSTDSICMLYAGNGKVSARYYLFNADKSVTYSIRREISESGNTINTTRYMQRRYTPASKMMGDTSHTQLVKESPGVTKEYLNSKLLKQYIKKGDTLKVLEYSNNMIINTSTYALDKNRNVLFYQRFQNGKKVMETKNTFNSAGLLVQRVASSFFQGTGIVTSTLEYDANKLLKKQLIVDNERNKTELTYSYVLDKNNEWKEITCKNVVNNNVNGANVRVTRKTAL